ncbi:MAG TPA: hypothetical protein PLK37_16800, partial [Terricaulis sp.]|nr:hypothetical protein [Terricaulis sp.]
MKLRAISAFAAALLLAACAFWSERAYFADSEGAHPFADGARFIWRESGSQQQQTIVFTRTGAGYTLQDIGAPDERPIEMLLVPVPETPEADFIAQVKLPNAEGARAYAFLWPISGGYRLLAAPGSLDELSAAEPVMVRQCTARPQGECRIGGRDAV